MTKLLQITSLLWVAGTSVAADPVELRCSPQDPIDNWIESVRIDVPNAKVWLQVSRQEQEIEVDLLHVGPEQLGARTYHFNWRVEWADEPIVNVFKLFRSTNEWRLVSAGMELRNGTMVLRAAGPNQVMACE